MKIKSVITLLLFACIFSHSIHAQQILKPAEPNEICMEAWQKYHKADVLWKTGWGLFGSGAGMTIGGMLWGTLAPDPWRGSKRRGSKWTQHPGFSIMCIGGGVFFASIPCLAVGQVRRKAAMKTYFGNQCSPETCKDIQINYKKANALWKSGWWIFGVGQGIAISGGVLFACTGNWGGLPPDTRDPRLDAACIAGLSILCVGEALTIASIPCLAVGQTRRKASSQMYQEHCSEDQPPLTFHLPSSANGLGIAMCF